VRDPLPWHLNYDSIPDYLAEARVENRVVDGGRHITKLFSNCDEKANFMPDGLLDYEGWNGFASNIDGRDGQVDSDGRPTATCLGMDPYNMVDWGPLDKRLVGFACTWDKPYPYNSFETVVGSDIRFNGDNSEVVFFDTKEKPDICGLKYDIEGVATHERGHTFGLGDLRNEKYRNQTMYGSLKPCSRYMRTLGHGDVEGLRWIYD